jgi:predicted DNA-binding ribbon-helix-helix protein
MTKNTKDQPEYKIVTIRLEATLNQRLKNVAEKSGLSTNNLVNRILSTACDSIEGGASMDTSKDIRAIRILMGTDE